MGVMVRDVATRPFTCARSDSILSVIETCLDNGTETCFVLDDDRTIIGRLTLADLRRAIVEGSAIRASNIGELLDSLLLDGQLPQNFWDQIGPDDGIAKPVLDAAGSLEDVQVDRSRHFIQIAKPTLSHQEFRYVLDAFLSTWISGKGPYIEKFEEEFAATVGMKHGIAVTNGTVALHLALEALGIGPGDEVIVPDLTFASTINAVLYCGAVPVIVDIDRHNWTMTAATIEAALTPRTKAIIPVHLYGRPAEMGPIAALAKARGLQIIEDCAEAHGARYAGRAVGQFSEIACFSFHANKLVTSGEGGICLTDDDHLAAVLRELRDNGMSTARRYWHDRVGYNYRMPHLQAAIGLAQLPRLERTIERNRGLEYAYRAAFSGLEEVRFPPPLGEEYVTVVWLVSVLVPAAHRDRLIAVAAEAGVELRPFFYPLSSMPPYLHLARPCPNADQLARCGLNLPTSQAVDAAVIEKVARVFRRVLTS